MKLLCIRHGIAVDGYEFPGGDAGRPLTEEGREKFLKILSLLSKPLGEKSILMWVSPFLRAQQTADLFETSFSVKERFESELLVPEASPLETLSGLVAKIPDDGFGCFVGHEPHLSSFMSLCLTGMTRPILEVKKGSATLLQFHGSIRAGSAVLRWSVNGSLTKCR